MRWGRLVFQDEASSREALARDRAAALQQTEGATHKQGRVWVWVWDWERELGKSRPSGTDDGLTGQARTTLHSQTHSQLPPAA